MLSLIVPNFIFPTSLAYTEGNLDVFNKVNLNQQKYGQIFQELKEIALRDIKNSDINSNEEKEMQNSIKERENGKSEIQINLVLKDMENIYNNLDEIQIDNVESYYELEPNNNINQANVVNNNYYGEPPYYIFGTITDYYFDLDYYRFDVKTPGTFDMLGIWVGDYSGFGWEDDLVFSLWDENDNIIAWSQLKGFGSDRYQHLVVDVEPGTYYLLVMQVSNYQYLYIGEWYGLSLIFEPSATEITIPDSNLENVIRSELNKQTGKLTDHDLASLTYLSGNFEGVKDLRGLEYAGNLQGLYLYGNEISDISPLSGLTSLEELDLGDNYIQDISPLSNLANLQYLSLMDNFIENIDVLSSLTNLTSLNLYFNAISNISPWQI